MTEKPGSAGWIIAGVICAICLWLIWLVQSNLYLVSFFALVAVCTGFPALVYFIRWSLYESVELDKTRREIQAITPELMVMRQAAQLTEAQAKIVPLMGYRAEVDMKVSEDGPLYFLRTEGGSVPLTFCEDFLRDCSTSRLRSIRSFQNDTPSQIFAGLLTEWLVGKGLAVPAHANEPAMWINEHAKRRAAAMIGVDIDEPAA